MVLESACFLPTALVNWTNISARLPYGINQDSPFKISFKAYRNNNSCATGGDYDEPFLITYLHGIGDVDPIKYDRAKNGGSLYISGVTTPVQFLATNEKGAGWSLFYNDRPAFDCYTDAGLKINCIPEVDTRQAYIGEIDEGDGGQIRIRLKSILQTVGDEVGAVDCYVNSISAGVILNGSNPTFIAVTTTTMDGEKYCEIDFDGANLSSVSQGSTSTTYTINVEIRAGAATKNICDPNTTASCAATKTYYLYVKGQGYHQLDLGRKVIGGHLGLNSYKDIKDEDCFGTDCHEDDHGGDKYTKGTVGEMTSLLMPAGIGGLLNKLGYMTCLDVKNVIGTVTHPIGIEGDSYNLKVMDSIKIRPFFMFNNANGVNVFDYRVELRKPNGQLKFAIEGDCAPTKPQYYFYSDDIHTDDPDRTEKQKFEMYILGQTPGTPSEVEIEFIMHRDDLEEPLDNTKKRWENMKQIFKYHFFDAGDGAGAPYQWEYKAWNTSSSKRKDWNPDNTNFNHSWNVARLFIGGDPGDADVMQTAIIAMESEASAASFATAFSTAYPEDKSCDAQTDSEQFNITVPSTTITWEMDGMASDNTNCKDSTKPIDKSSINITGSGSYTFPSDTVWGEDRVADGINFTFNQTQGALSQALNGTAVTGNGSICTYVNTTGEHLNFYWDSFAYTLTSSERIQDKVYNSAICEKVADRKYGIAKGSGSWYGTRGDWNTSASYSHAMAIECFDMSVVDAPQRLHTADGYDCTDDSGLSNYLSGNNLSTYYQTPAAMAGFSSITATEWSIDYVADDSDASCSSSNCFVEDNNLGL